MKSKSLTVTSEEEALVFCDSIVASAEETQMRLLELAGRCQPLELLERMKFEMTGVDPLDIDRPLNVIEQLNQTFTYLASFLGAAWLFNAHPKISSLTLNLGTASGWDIETEDQGGIIAEVFASVRPSNNNKLNSDISRLQKFGADAAHRYVFFLCPGFDAGLVQESNGVQVRAVEWTG